MKSYDTTISTSVIRRLPRYYRFLNSLEEQNILRISSKELAAMTGLTASQIRQDLNCFGDFGHQGYGYNVPELKNSIADILGIRSEHTSILIGAGNLGRAIANKMSFGKEGFRLIGIFDTDPVYAGMEIRGISILSDEKLEEFCCSNSPEIAVLCIPDDSAPAMVKKLVSLGIKNFWNFSHFDIKREFPNVFCENVHLSDSLMYLSYNIKNKKSESDD